MAEFSTTEKTHRTSAYFPLTIIGIGLFWYYHSAFIGHIDNNPGLLVIHYGSICISFLLASIKPIALWMKTQLSKTPLLVLAYLLYMSRITVLFGPPFPFSIIAVSLSSAAYALLTCSWLEYALAVVLPKKGDSDYLFVSLASSFCALWTITLFTTSGLMYEPLSLLSCGISCAIHCLLFSSRPRTDPNASISESGRRNKSAMKHDYGMYVIIVIFGLLYGFRQYGDSLSGSLAVNTIPSFVGTLSGALLMLALSTLANNRKREGRYLLLINMIPVVSAIALMAFAFDVISVELGQFIFSLSHMLFFTFMYVFILRTTRRLLSPIRAFAFISLLELIFEAGILIGVLLFGLTIEHPDALKLVLLLILAIVVASATLISRRHALSLSMEKGESETSINHSIGKICEKISSDYGLSKRESEVLFYLVQGWTQNKIAEDLFIAPSTVKVHVKRIYERIGIHSKTQLLDLYHQELIDSEFGTMR